MIITFFSNYFNHHQQALCDALNALPDVEFYFVETEPMESFRSDMGWGVDELPSYVVSAYLDMEKRQFALELSSISDLVIIGSAPEWYVESRIKRDQLTFRYTERPMKEGAIKMFIPRLAKKFYKLHFSNRNKKQLYVLGASAYAAYDYSLLKSYENKCLKFGYFPKKEEKSFEEIKEIKGKSFFGEDISAGEAVNILWTGRFLKLKRADLLVKALKRLSDKGYAFKLQFVGNGEEEDSLKKLVRELGLVDKISFHDFVKPDEVRELMEKANIYVMTSNHLEGWGSVIYEALSAGCAVVASHACGCSPWLVHNEKTDAIMNEKRDTTGLIFKSGDVDSLADKLELLIKDKSYREMCQINSYNQMQKLWNPEVAAVRIRDFALTRKSYEDGPLSLSGILKNDWYKD